MLLSYSIDYAKACFEHEVIPKILGSPSLDRLKGTKKKVRDKSTSAQSELGGGAHGYLGITNDDATSFTMAGHHYDRPVDLFYLSSLMSPLIMNPSACEKSMLKLLDFHGRK